MQEPHICLRDKDQEINITILERAEGQPLGMDDNYDLPARFEYNSKTESFVKELIYLETYELVNFYCRLDDVISGCISTMSFSFAEPYITFLLENKNDKIDFTFYYKENEEDRDGIKIKQKFTFEQFDKLKEDVHRGCNIWVDDSELIDFREYLYDLEDEEYFKNSLTYRVATVEYLNSFGRYYYYLCEDEFINRYDLVVVPSFRGKESIVRVLDIEDFTEDELPCPLDKMKSVIKKYVKPLSKKIEIAKYSVLEPGLGFEVLVNFVTRKNDKAEFLIKDEHAYFDVCLNRHVDVYLEVYKDMLMLKPNEMEMTKPRWVYSDKVLHVGFVEEENQLKTMFTNILEKTKEFKKHSVGIPCLLENYCGISPKTIFETAFSVAKEWVLKNLDYKMEVMFCCPDQKLYETFKAYYDENVKEEED